MPGPPGSPGSWFKGDVDGDGRTDLVVVGCESEYLQNKVVWCFLNQGKQRFQKIDLSDGADDCVVPQGCFVNGRAAIRYAHLLVAAPLQRKRGKLRCKADTLVFDKGQFVEYNRAPRDYGIRQVLFSAGPCYGRCPVFRLALTAAGAATYQAGVDNPRQGSFTAAVAPAAVQELWALLNYLNFPKLQDNYVSGGTDQPTVTLTITYTGGRVKTIRDYGQQGTFGLSRAYSLLFALRTSQRWR